MAGGIQFVGQGFRHARHMNSGDGSCSLHSDEMDEDFYIYLSSRDHMTRYTLLLFQQFTQRFHHSASKTNPVDRKQVDVLVDGTDPPTGTRTPALSMQ